MSAAIKLKICSVCDNEFQPTRGDRQHVCQGKKCKAENRSRTHKAWREKNGLVNPKKNLWTEEDIQFLRDNRFMSTKEISLALGRSADSVKEKRCRYKLPRLAVCKTCGITFKRINQHNQCEDCTPDQRGYAKDYRNSMNGRWQMYKNNASRRGLSFDLTIEKLAEFWQQPCSYCGDEIETVGIDRIDSNRGYEDGNLISCCGRCNEMKMDSTTEDWVSHMKKILTNLGEIK